MDAARQTVDSNGLPPNQSLAAPGRWPVVGEKAPGPGPAEWRVAVAGAVERPATYGLDDLRQLGWTERSVDIHCVTRWSKPGARFGGVPLATLLDAAVPAADAAFVICCARSGRRHTTSLSLADVRALDPLVALEFDGAPLSPEHGGPVRVVTPGRYFYKSLKWLETIDVALVDVPGYWEREAGYHNHADPWLEERYEAPGYDPSVARAALAALDVVGRDLRGLRAAGRSLAGLAAGSALLRDADFRGADLRGATFRDANLSNAHLAQACLEGADFTGADLEGADFAAASLLGATFRGASLFGATFCREGEPGSDATLDGPDQLSPEQRDALTPAQRACVERAAAGRNF